MYFSIVTGFLTLFYNPPIVTGFLTLFYSPPIVTGFLTLFYSPYKIGPSKEYRYQTNIQVWPYRKTYRIKQSHYRPGQALRVPGGWGTQISRQAHESGKVVSLSHRPPLPPLPRKHSWYSFLWWVNPRAIVRQKGLCQWKIPSTLSGIEPVTFQLVAQCLNQLHHHIPLRHV